MKTELKAKFLQHLLSKKKANEGFTLVELLVVVIIIGILAAIALPSMLNQASKARLAGAQNAVGAINRSQQAYRLEQPRFATDITELKIGSVNAQGYGISISTGTSELATSLATPSDTATDKGVTGCVKATGGVTTSTVTTAATATPPACPL